MICPAISTVLNNTYQIPVKLFVSGGEEIELSEGFIQGDPLAIEMYALAMTPLIWRLRSDEPSVKQVWFAYDSQGGGNINPLRRWWQAHRLDTIQMQVKQISLLNHSFGKRQLKSSKERELK